MYDAPNISAVAEAVFFDIRELGEKIPNCSRPRDECLTDVDTRRLSLWRAGRIVIRAAAHVCHATVRVTANGGRAAAARRRDGRDP